MALLELVYQAGVLFDLISQRKPHLMPVEVQHLYVKVFQGFVFGTRRKRDLTENVACFRYGLFSFPLHVDVFVVGVPTRSSCGFGCRESIVAMRVLRVKMCFFVNALAEKERAMSCLLPYSWVDAWLCEESPSGIRA